MAGKSRNPGPPKLTIVKGSGRRSSASNKRSERSLPKKPLTTRVYFARGGSTPTGNGLGVLRRCAEWLVGNRSRKVLVVGHANQRNWDKASRALADERARTVRDLVIWLGALPGQVRRGTPSQLHRLRAGATRAERQAHRYVELIMVPGDDLLLAELAVPDELVRGEVASRGGRRIAG